MERMAAAPTPLSGSAEGPANLRDGRPVAIRRLRDDDRPLLEEFLKHLSDRSLTIRFFAPVPRATALAELVRGTSSTERCALVMLATFEGRPMIIGHAEYARDGIQSPGAEVAFLVADAFQGHGCATLLLGRLARAARAVGIREFHAAVRMENDQMLAVFRDSGYPIEEWWGPDAVKVTFPIAAKYETASLRSESGVSGD